ncbi:hypothetical protein C0V77_20840 [Emticicia sp. TH156]|nr:hypothetical protein C0V77_20840 [Emticicia sp. TH156]
MKLAYLIKCQTRNYRLGISGLYKLNKFMAIQKSRNGYHELNYKHIQPANALRNDFFVLRKKNMT